MKRDTVAAVAVAVAILVMVACVVLSCAGPARAEETDLYLGPAEIKCQEALAAMENRSWAQLIEQLSVPGEERSSLSLSVSPVPEGQAPRAVKPKDVRLAHAFRFGGDTVIFENMDGGGRCMVRCHNHMVMRGGEIRPEWVIEQLSLAGVGEARRGPDVIVRK